MHQGIRDVTYFQDLEAKIRSSYRGFGQVYTNRNYQFKNTLFQFELRPPVYWKYTITGHTNHTYFLPKKNIIFFGASIWRQCWTNIILTWYQVRRIWRTKWGKEITDVMLQNVAVKIIYLTKNSLKNRCADLKTKMQNTTATWNLVYTYRSITGVCLMVYHIYLNMLNK